MATDRESPKPSPEPAKPKRRLPRSEPRQVAPTPPPPPPATGIVAGDLRHGDDPRRGRTGPTTHHDAGRRAPRGPLGGDWGLMAKAPPPAPTPPPREERVSDDFARPPGYRPDMDDEGPRGERQQTAKSPGATADRHSQDRRSAPRGRFAAPKPQKAPKPLSGREFNDGLRRGGVDPDRPVTPDTLRQAVGERDYQRRRDPGLFAGVAAGFRSLFPGDVARDATGRMKPSTPRGGVTFRSVLDELGIGSLDAAHSAGRRKATAKAAGTFSGGSGDDTLGGQSGEDTIFGDGGPARAVTDEQIDTIEVVYRSHVKTLRAWGLDFAADNLERFLDRKGGTKVIDRDEARKLEPIAKAEKTNQDRFERSFLMSGGGGEPPHSFYEAVSQIPDGQTVDLGNDKWQVAYRGWSTLGHITIGEWNLALGAGRTQVNSDGSFKATRRGDTVKVVGEVTHTWRDPYDFHPMQEYADGALALQQHGRALPFELLSEWTQTVRGVIKLKGGIPDEASFDWIDEPGKDK